MNNITTTITHHDVNVHHSTHYFRQARTTEWTRTVRADSPDAALARVIALYDDFQRR